MGLMLKPEMHLEKNAGAGYVTFRKGESGGKRQPVFLLHPLHGLILSLFDGERTKEEVVEIVTGIFDHPLEKTRTAVDGTLERFRLFLAEKEQLGDSLSRHSPEPSDFLFPSSYDFKKIRESAPQALLFVVTECCNRNCLYCYKDAKFVGDGPATDLGLSFERIRELADESAEIGITNLILTGGEPFLRSDLIDIIRLFVERGIEVIPITKSLITGERMKALKATGLEALHVSLDSHRKSTVDDLTNVPGTFDEIVETLHAANTYALPIVLRPVLSSRNVGDLDLLVDFAYGLGVRQFIVDVYAETPGRHDERLDVEKDSRARLKEIGNDLKERYPDVRIELKFEESSCMKRGSGKGCVEGSKGLTFLPDGQVTKCEHWRFGNQLTYGDLRSQSIMEVWESESLIRINQPSRELFQGTVCYRCKRFDTCNHVRGRCSLSSLLGYDTVYAPDTYCPIGAFKKGARQLKVLDNAAAC